MTVLATGQRATEDLPAYSALTIIASASGAGTVERLGDRHGEPPQSTAALAAGTTTIVGPFAAPTRHRISATGDSLTYGIAPVDFPSAAEAAAAAAAAAALLYLPVTGTIGDVKEYVGSGAPVDYTDGTPPATGEGVAGIGSRYTDITAGKLYINGGTKAQPVWKLVTSAT